MRRKLKKPVKRGSKSNKEIRKAIKNSSTGTYLEIRVRKK